MYIFHSNSRDENGEIFCRDIVSFLNSGKRTRGPKKNICQQIALENNFRSRTNLARSVTLVDTSWSRLTNELTSWNLPDSQLHIESKTEPSVAKAPNYIGRGGDSAHTFLMGEEL